MSCCNQDHFPDSLPEYGFSKPAKNEFWLKKIKIGCLVVFNSKTIFLQP
jgi:hypothetical protein